MKPSIQPSSKFKVIQENQTVVSIIYSIVSIYVLSSIFTGMLFKIPLVSTGRVHYEHYCQDHHGHEQDSDGGQGQLGHLARLSLPLLKPQTKVRKDFTYQAPKHGKVDMKLGGQL